MRLLGLFLPMLLSFVFANVEDPIDKTAELIKQGDIHELAKNFASTIELNIIGEENIYSSTQAELILTNFFKNNQPKSVKILHRISSNANYRFAVLILTTVNGVYRASFALKNINGQFELNELRIETEKTK
jgi:F420-0:gamma-glutamyl ligase